MGKTVTIRVDDDVYSMFKRAADGQKRTLSNFIEYAALAYLVNDMYVDDREMAEVIKNSAGLRAGLSDADNGRYTILG
jgi:predicted transcriptional regulator